jgi:hypothetical protein
MCPAGGQVGGGVTVVIVSADFPQSNVITCGIFYV